MIGDVIYCKPDASIQTPSKLSSSSSPRSTLSPSRPSSCPNPYCQRLADRPNLFSQFHKHAQHRKPAVPRSTRRSRPLASRASTWTTSLFRKDFTVYRRIRVSFICFPISFYFRLSALHSSFLFYFRLLPANVAAPSSPSSSTRSLSRTLL